jgi:hypothetical protein
MDYMRVVMASVGSALLFQLGAQNPRPPQKIEVPEAGINLPMSLMGGRPLVDVHINGKGPYRFILDTGAEHSVVDDGLKDQLSLDPVQAAAHSPGGAARIASLGVGGATLEGVIVQTAPITRMFGGSDAPRGVLSAASFPGYLVVLDYPAKRILIHKGELSAPDARTRFEYTSDQILPNVPVRVGGVEVRAHVDTGSPGSLTLPTKYLKELPLSSEPTEVGRARTPNGEFSIWSGQITGDVDLGQYRLDLKNLEFSDVNPIPGPPTGNLGSQVLRQFVVTLDSKNRRIQFDR